MYAFVSFDSCGTDTMQLTCSSVSVLQAIICIEEMKGSYLSMLPHTWGTIDTKSGFAKLHVLIT